MKFQDHKEELLSKDPEQSKFKIKVKVNDGLLSQYMIIKSLSAI